MTLEDLLLLIKYRNHVIAFFFFFLKLCANEQLLSEFIIQSGQQSTAEQESQTLGTAQLTNTANFWIIMFLTFP